MTTTPAFPADTSPGVRELPAPCWYIGAAGTGAHIDFLSETHEPTEQEARNTLASRDDAAELGVFAYPTPCAVAYLACGEQFHAHDDNESCHFDSVGDLIRELRESGLPEVTPGVFLCDDDTCSCAKLWGDVVQEQSLRDTSPDVLSRGVVEGWADPVFDPRQIDWDEKRRTALVPFGVFRGRPVNPLYVGDHPFGRNQLGHWGEQVCGDAIVQATVDGARYTLMIERGDGFGWALPGGTAEPGEDAVTCALRELQEETGLTVDRSQARLVEVDPQIVPDPRGSGEAWMTTCPVIVFLGDLPALPGVAGADDAVRAAWLRSETPDVLEDDLAARFKGKVFAAHRRLVQSELHWIRIGRYGIVDQAGVVDHITRLARHAIHMRLGTSQDAVISVEHAGELPGEVIVHLNSGDNSLAVEQHLTDYGFHVEPGPQTEDGVKLAVTTRTDHARTEK